jgi:TonB-linked SusC/RagA family outer membrane protein
MSTPAQTEDLKVILDRITRETGFLFTYPENMVRDVRQVSIPAGTRSVSATLDLALRGTGLRYWQSNRMVAIFKDMKKDEEEEEPKEKPLYTVSGLVADVNGMALPLATITVKGMGTNTIADAEGHFLIKARAADVLVVSLMSYKAREIPVEGRSVVTVQLEDDVAVLNEIEVSTWYWSSKERENTGNISWMKEEQIRRTSVTNPIATISGQMPGVFVRQRSGLPGGGYDLTIREKNSLRSQGNYPLYLVDGVPYPATTMSSQAVGGTAIPFSSPLTYISPSDIQRIEILKDADATAIYGSRGANGVVLITTKKGVEGETKINVNVNQGTGEPTRLMPLLNTSQWIALRQEAFRNDGKEPRKEHIPPPNASPTDRAVYSDAPDLNVWPATRNTDWQRKFLSNPARFTEAQLSVNSGTKQTQFYFGGNFRKENTVFPGDFGALRGSGHFNLNHRSNNERFKMSFTATYLINYNKLPKIDFTPMALTLPPNAPELYGDDGQLNLTQPYYWTNPLLALRQLYKSTSDNMMMSGAFSYVLVPGLTLKVPFGYTKVGTQEVSTVPISSYPESPTGEKFLGSSVHGDNSVHTWITEPQIELEKNISRGKLSMLAGGTFQESTLSANTLSAQGYTSDGLLESLNGAALIQTVEDYDAKYRYIASFARINYNWQGKYILNLTGRRDGSSRFALGSRFANFGAVGASWIFSEEKWMKGLQPWLSFGKLRGSYGKTGSDLIGDYQFMDLYADDGLKYDKIRATPPTQLPTSRYSWESNRKLEAALRLGFLNERVMIETSWYRNESSQQLVGENLTYITGFRTVQWNAPVVVLNTGWEFLINTVNVSTGNFSWRSSANLTIPKNKLASFPDLNLTSYKNQYEVGYPLSLTKTYHVTGVDPQTGVYVIEDVNQDGKFDTNDLQPLKSRSHDFYGGLQNTLIYKALELDFSFQFVRQTGFNYLQSLLTIPGFRNGNQPRYVLDRWQKPGDQVSIQKFTQDPSGDATNAYRNVQANSDMIISDASFVRLKSASLTYHLRPAWIERLRLTRCSLYVQGQNLYTWTHYLGSDPETQDGRILPPLRTVSFGVQLTL